MQFGICKIDGLYQILPAIRLSFWLHSAGRYLLQDHAETPETSEDGSGAEVAHMASLCWATLDHTS